MERGAGIRKWKTEDPAKEVTGRYLEGSDRGGLGRGEGQHRGLPHLTDRHLFFLSKRQGSPVNT